MATSISGFLWHLLTALKKGCFWKCQTEICKLVVLEMAPYLHSEQELFCVEIVKVRILEHRPDKLGLNPDYLCNIDPIA